MTNNWKSTTTGGWNVASYWSANVTPAPSDDVVIAAVGASYISFINASYSIDSLAVNSINALVFQDSGDALNVTKSITLTAGTLDLNTANSINTSNVAGGGVAVAGGTLSVANAAALGSTANSTLTLTGGLLLGTLNETIANNIVVGSSGNTISATIAAAAGATLTLSGSIDDKGQSDTLTFGASADSGTVVLASSTLAGNNVSLVVADGVLRLGAGTFLGLGSTIAIAAGATLDVNGNGVISDSLSGAGTLTDGGAAATAFLVGGGSFKGIISGALSLEMISGTTAADEVILSGANTFSGTTTVLAGTLVATNAHALSTGAVTLTTGSELEGDTSSGSLTIANAINVGATPGGFATLANGGGNNLAFTGLISGSGELAISRAVELDGANTYSGGTLIESGGALKLGAGASAGSGAIIFGGFESLLDVATGNTIGNVIEGFGSYDGIIFDDVTYAADDTVSVAAAAPGEQTVSVKNAANATVASFTVAGNYSAQQFALIKNGSGLGLTYSPIINLNVSGPLANSPTQTLSGTVGPADANALVFVLAEAIGGGPNSESEVLTTANSAGNWTATLSVPASATEVLYEASGSPGGSAPTHYAVLGTTGGLVVPFLDASGDSASLYNTAGILDTVNGSGGTVYLTNAQATVNGGGNTISVSAGSTLTVGGNGAGGVSDAVSGASMTVTLLASSRMDLTGSSDIVNAGATSNLGVIGTGDTITLSAGDALWLVGAGAGATSDGVFGSSATITLSANSRMDLVGSSDKVYAGATSNLGVTGTDDTINLGAGDALWLTGAGSTATSDIVSGSSATVNLSANSRMDLTGSNDKLFVGATSNLGVTGIGDIINLSSGDALWLSGAGATVASDMVFGASAMITLSANSRMDLTGSADKVFAGATSNLGVSGTGDAISLSAGDGLWLAGAGATATSDVVSGSSATVSLSANSRMDLTGSGDNVYAGATSNLGVTGTGDTITLGSGDGLWIGVGTGTVVSVAANDSVNDGGTGTKLQIGSNVGTLGVYNFAADTTGVIDLLNGVGGYSTAAAAASALTGDGSGGSLLSLGANGKIDFVGLAPSALNAGNFAIG